ncbi:nucleotidyltransferase family protein [Devosia sp. ZB163]|uniref:nucleotidyltransferase family protein n=1 Tax=Devosia sp. ZB163 TaxID=3025938 RepID=UPI00235E0DEF|nr:nucleotidyltransferase family protein [Devosia sp. ZB163]MDC9824726.1 nucleotidyltransferase family protein [Devosia sp. ZB163]
MSNHLRLSGLSAAAQADALREIIRSSDLLSDVLVRARALNLPDCWLVSGAIYNTVWNHLTGRSPLTGINDIDLFYFDATDLSYEAEDRTMKNAEAVFADLPLPAQLRNQARVHLWYPERFGGSYPPLRSSCEAVDRFATVAHSVAARLGGAGDIELYAPFGLDDVFSFRLAPNRTLDNRVTHTKKGERARSVWPEIVFEPW